jgi:SAM-dependent methyltransferase
MPVAVPDDEPRSLAALRAQYELERDLAERLRRSSKEARRRLYGTVYDEFFRRVGREDRQGQDQVALEYQLVAPFVGPSTVFLEIGAGEGALVATLAPGVARVFAVDASPAGWQVPPGNVTHLVASGPSLDLAGGSIDVAYSCHFVEHLHPDDLGEHLRDVHRVLKRGGVYLCVTPNRLLGPHDVSRYFADVPHGLHLREYTHRELGQAMRRAGFCRVAVLRGPGEHARLGSVALFGMVESLLSPIPPGLRRSLLASRLLGGRRPPFRRLEQVKLVATKERSA